ncbi:MAG: AsmA-like C-terminal region-containing protein, partial [Rhodospirillaceae bacterium]
ALGMNAASKSISLRADIDGFNAENVARAMRQTDLITQGELDLAINVRGSGNTVQAVMSSLNGSVIGGMAESRIRSDALNVIGADVIMQVASMINPMGNRDPYTVARCAAVNLQISGGVARAENGIALVTDKMQITSSGQIDFSQERLNFNVRPRATGGIGVGLGQVAEAISVSGSLANPGVGIDKTGAVKAIGRIGAAIATGGLSIFAEGAANRVTEGGDPCQEARTWHMN